MYKKPKEQIFIFAADKKQIIPFDEQNFRYWL